MDSSSTSSQEPKHSNIGPDQSQSNSNINSYNLEQEEIPPNTTNRPIVLHSEQDHDLSDKNQICSPANSNIAQNGSSARPGSINSNACPISDNSNQISEFNMTDQNHLPSFERDPNLDHLEYQPNQDQNQPNQDQNQPNQDQNQPNQDQNQPNQDQNQPNQDQNQPNQDQNQPNQDQNQPNQDQNQPNQDQNQPNQDQNQPNQDQNQPNQDQYPYDSDDSVDQAFEQLKSNCFKYYAISVICYSLYYIFLLSLLGIFFLIGYATLCYGINLCIFSPFYFATSILGKQNAYSVIISTLQFLTDFGIYMFLASNILTFCLQSVKIPKPLYSSIKSVKVRFKDIYYAMAHNELAPTIGMIAFCLILMGIVIYIFISLIAFSFFDTGTFAVMIASMVYVGSFFFMIFKATCFEDAYCDQEWCNEWEDFMDCGQFFSSNKLRMINSFLQNGKRNMMTSKYENCRFPDKQKYIKWSMIIIIFAIQLAALIIFGVTLDYNITTAELTFVILFRFLLLFHAMNYNIVDIIINYDRTKENLGKFNTVIMNVFLVYYAVLIVYLIGMAIYNASKDQPDTSILRYIENNEIWYKYSKNNTRELPPPFCHKTSMSDSLYGVRKDGKCYIKPNKRGVFNSTMKYIFGRNYEDDGIKIYCFTYSHSPYLVITSEKLFNSTTLIYSDISEEMMKEGREVEVEVNKTSYFDAHNLPESKVASEEKKILEDCIDANMGDCYEEWDNFTNKYWTGFSSDYQELGGLEQYEISINKMEIKDGYYFQPRISYDKTNISGTHFIVGGCFEDYWGYGYLAEMLSRTYLPIVFEELVPLYSLYRERNPGFFQALDQYNGNCMLITRLSNADIYYLNHLLNLFGIDNTQVFLIGHSVSAASMKGIIPVHDFPGISFETVSFDIANVIYSDKKYEKVNRIGKSMLNIYERDSFISSKDKQIDENGALPGVFWNPNAIDTACLTAISCSDTKKYVPYCLQTLNQEGKNPEKEFKRIYNIAMEYSDITINDIEKRYF